MKTIFLVLFYIFSVSNALTELKYDDKFIDDVFIYSEQSFDNNIQLVSPNDYICNSTIRSPFRKKVVAFCPTNNVSYTQLNSTYFQFYNGGKFELEYTIIGNSTSIPTTKFFVVMNSTRIYPRGGLSFDQSIYNDTQTFNVLNYSFQEECKFFIQSSNISDAFFILNSVRVYETDHVDYSSNYTLFYSHTYSTKDNDGIIDIGDSRDYFCNDTFICPNMLDFNGEFELFCPTQSTYGVKYLNLPPQGIFEVQYTYCDRSSNDFPTTYLDFILNFFWGTLTIQKITLFDSPAFPVDLSINKKWTWKTLYFSYKQNFSATNDILVYSKQRSFDNHLILGGFKFYINKTASIYNPHCFGTASFTINSWFLDQTFCKNYEASDTPCIDLSFLFSGYDPVNNEQKKQIMQPVTGSLQILEGFVFPSNVYVEYVGKEAKELDIYVYSSYSETNSQFGLSLGFPIPFTKGFFSGSAAYQQTMYKLVRESKTRVTTFYEKEEIEVQLDPNYQFSLDFKTDLLNLPTNVALANKNLSQLIYGSSEYDALKTCLNFIGTYGIFFVTKVKLGGKVNVLAEVNRCEIYKYSSKSLFLKGYAKRVDKLKVAGGISQNTTDSDSFYQKNNFRVDVHGGITSLFCCDNCNVKKWADSVIKNLEVISFQIENITYLIDDSDARENLEAVINYYLEQSDKNNQYNSTIDDFTCSITKIKALISIYFLIISMIISFN